MVKKMALKTGTFKTGKDNLDILQKEVAIMKKICHENLVRLYEIIDDDEGGKIYFIMDYMDLGSLGGSRHLSFLGCKEPCLPVENIWNYFRQSVSGLDYCMLKKLLFLSIPFCSLTILVHNIAKVIHFDIKPDNILINKSDVIKIADFGISKMKSKSENFSKVGGTRMFLPPET